MGIDGSIGAFLKKGEHTMANNAWITSGKDLKKEQKMRQLLSDTKKRNEANALIAERGIVLKEKTKEFLDNYFFRKDTTIRVFAGEIIIHSKDGAWSDEVWIKQDGSYIYSGGYFCLW